MTRKDSASRGGFDFSTVGTGRSGRASIFDTGGMRHRQDGGEEEDRDTLRIPAGSRKAALVYLGMAAWRAGLLDPKELGEVRGREVDEAGLQRALYRSSMGEIEHALGPIVKGERIVWKATSPEQDAPPSNASAPK